MNNNISNGIVYILTNPAMPGLVKIGKTTRNDVDIRLKELYSTGVPLPFECAYAARVNDELQTEKAFHQAFDPYRINQKREFFQIEQEQAIALLRLLAIEDVTPQIQEEANSIDVSTKVAANKLKAANNPKMNFFEMGIPIHSVLTFPETGETAIVISENKVSFNSEEYSLSALTKELLNLDYYVRPASKWFYNNKSLLDIYNETYRTI